MQIEINEDELKEWANNQIRKRMGDRINTLMREWDWNSYMRDAVDRVVGEKITDEAVKRLIENIDKDSMIKAVSDRIATEIADSLQIQDLINILGEHVMVVDCVRAVVKGGHAEVLNGKNNSSRSQP